MQVQDLANLSVHGLLIIAVLYLLKRQNNLEIMLIKCVGGDKPTDDDLNSLNQSL